MRSLPLFRFNARARSTSWGIALCTMFIVASFSVAGGLESSVERLSDVFESEYQLVTFNGAHGPEYFNYLDLPEVSTGWAYGIITDAVLEPWAVGITVFSSVDRAGILGLSWPTGDQIWQSGTSFPSMNASLVVVGTAQVTVAGTFSSSMFPEGWFVVSQGILQSVVGVPEDCNYAIGKGVNEATVNYLEDHGFTVQPLVGIVGFLDTSVNELQKDVLWVLVPSAFVIAVLAYSFIGSEATDRRHDIGIIKTLGAGRLRILSYIVSDALLIGLWGAGLGVALGITLSYAMSTVASNLFTSVFVLSVDEMVVASAFLATVGAVLVGALIPALRMTLTTPVDDLKEVRA